MRASRAMRRIHLSDLMDMGVGGLRGRECTPGARMASARWITRLDPLARLQRRGLPRRCKQARENPRYEGCSQVFWMTMFGNLPDMSFCSSPIFTATRRAIAR